MISEKYTLDNELQTGKPLKAADLRYTAKAAAAASSSASALASLSLP